MSELKLQFKRRSSLLNGIKRKFLVEEDSWKKETVGVLYHNRASQFNYLACHSSRWSVPYIRTFMNWFAERFAEKEAHYEKGFAKLFGEELLHELMTS